jgi:hypothetical protein
VLLVDVLLVVVVVIKFIGVSTEFVHIPTEVTLIIVVPSGTTLDVYPACNTTADIFVANGIV